MKKKVDMSKLNDKNWHKCLKNLSDKLREDTVTYIYFELSDDDLKSFIKLLNVDVSLPVVELIK